MRLAALIWILLALMVLGALGAAWLVGSTGQPGGTVTDARVPVELDALHANGVAVQTDA